MPDDIYPDVMCPPRLQVLNWRNKIEQDINEVLQVASVFTNVSKVRK